MNDDHELELLLLPKKVSNSDEAVKDPRSVNQGNRRWKEQQLQVLGTNYKGGCTGGRLLCRANGGQPYLLRH